MYSSLNNIFLLLAVVCLAACSSVPTADTAHPPKKDSIPAFDEKASQIATPGVLGVYRMPAVMVLAVTDSAAMPNVPAKVSDCYRAIGDDIKHSGAITIGAFAQMMYNNDSANFRFTCMAPILQLPPRAPEKCQVLTLSEANMLVYNYYGPYQGLHLGYSEMKDYMVAHGLEQVGALREFYLTNPVLESDSTKWLTRILAPVAVTGKK